MFIKGAGPLPPDQCDVMAASYAREGVRGQLWGTDVSLVQLFVGAIRPCNLAYSQCLTWTTHDCCCTGQRSIEISGEPRLKPPKLRWRKTKAIPAPRDSIATLECCHFTLRRLASPWIRSVAFAWNIPQRRSYWTCRNVSRWMKCV